MTTGSRSFRRRSSSASTSLRTTTSPWAVTNTVGRRPRKLVHARGIFGLGEILPPMPCHIRRAQAVVGPLSPVRVGVKREPGGRVHLYGSRPHHGRALRIQRVQRRGQDQGRARTGDGHELSSQVPVQCSGILRSPAKGRIRVLGRRRNSCDRRSHDIRVPSPPPQTCSSQPLLDGKTPRVNFGRLP